jgi:hypothetical protein
MGETPKTALAHRRKAQGNADQERERVTENISNNSEFSKLLISTPFH